MPSISRVELDKHIGHACIIEPYHQTPYKTGSENVFINGAAVVRIGDECACSDVAVEGSTSVFVNGIGVHRKEDATSGHGCWVANKSASGSPNVFAG
jgi:uncharacterized Zn-binding protein involved in type VI secretion